MDVQPVIRSQTCPKFNLTVCYLAIMLMAGIMVVKWIPQLYSVFPVSFYLTLHTIIEFLGVVVSTAVFIVAWYNFQHTRSMQELIICLTFLAMGIISFAHALSYNGMPDFFTPNSVNKASTYWIFFRLLRAVGIFAAVVFRPKLLKAGAGALGYLFATVTLVVMAIVLIAVDPGVLPRMYVTGVGQTALKVVLEFVGIGLETVALIYLWMRKQYYMEDRFLTAALIFLIFSSVAFTLYSSAYDTYNLIGHIYMVAAFILILRGLFVGSVVRLYEANRFLEEQRRKLAEVNTELERLNQLKTDFLANTNHELRTPLTSIIGFTEMLLDRETGPLNEIQRDYLLEINDSSQRLLVDINNLLDLSKLEAGQMKVNLKNGSLVEVAGEVLRQFKPLFRQKNQHISAILPEQLPPMAMDREKVKKVLVNLLSNAHKFAPEEGCIGLIIEVQPDQDTVIVSVTDDGIGLNWAEADNVFEKFYQAEGASRRHEGTGLGLTLAKHFVELHGGRIWVASEPGQGTTFSFSLPLGQINEEVV